MSIVFSAGPVVEVPNSTVVVRLKESDKLISGLRGATQSANICGMPVENVFEKLNDEVMLPNSRPRNSP
jgi:uncharacterized OB-fold protein